MPFLVIAVLLFSLIASTDAQTPPPSPSPAPNPAPFAKGIHAVLAPPTTTYTITASDPDGDALTYAWTNSNTCGTFTPSGASAVWNHGEPTDCSHDGPYHPGTIEVVIGDGHGNSITRDYYDGSLSGDGSYPGSTSACGASGVAGVFEPTQGVWQDDDLFQDQAGKQLTKKTDRAWDAELDMVQGRDALLFGVKGDRNNIHFNGGVTGTINAPVIVRWTLADATGDHVVAEYDNEILLPVEGACDASNAFHIIVPTPSGMPTGGAFRFASPGGYTIRMELVEKNGGLVQASDVDVSGNVRTVSGVKILVEPVVMSAWDTSASAATGVAPLVGAAKRIATELSTFSQDYFPVAPGGVAARARPVELDLTKTRQAAEQRCKEIAAKTGKPLNTRCARDVLEGALASELATSAWFQGADRVVGVLRDRDFNILQEGQSDAVARTMTTKSIVSREGNDHWDVSHEVAHTLPRYLWSAPQMVPECKVNFHNVGKFGNGYRVDTSGHYGPAAENQKAGLMGPDDASKDYWIEQCTFWHLEKALNAKADPATWSLVGWVVSDANGTLGGFDPSYTRDGTPDLDANGAGNYSFVVKDATGATLAAYRFEPEFANENGDYTRYYVSFAHSIPQTTGASAIELDGPGGAKLATLNVTGPTPAIAATPPATPLPATALTDGFDVAWSVPAGAPALAAVRATVSVDNGASADDLAVDTTNHTVHVPGALLAPGGTATVSLVATTGLQSASASVTVALPGTAPATPPGTTTTTTTTPSTTTSTPPSGGKTPGFDAVIAIAAVGAVALAARRRG